MSDTIELLDEESLKCLEQAKKGKPRRFALICKGEKIVSLVLYKKGSLAKYKKQAKEQGQGLFFHGVVDGKGANLSFKLARADGFEDAPTKDVKLKAHLNETSGGTFKPIFEIVDHVPLVLDEDDPLVQRFLALQPQVLKASDKDPEAARFLNQLCEEAGAALQEDDAAASELKIVAIERALKRVQGDTVVPPEELLWIRERDAIQPDLDECLNKNLGDVQKLKIAFNFAQQKAGAGDFAAAIKSLSILRKLINEARSAPPKGPEIPPGTAQDAIPGMEIRTARMQAVRGIAELVKALRATQEKRAVEIAEIIHAVGENFPTHMEKLLDGLAKAERAKNQDMVKKIKAGAQQAAKDWVAYLNKHSLSIEGCEKNPWKIPVSINQPIKTQLKSILTNVAG
jgi:hypothetical protein